MLFLTKSSSARRSVLALLLALCCLSSALGAKITKKVEKPPANANNNEDNAETAVEAAVEAAQAAIENAANDDDDDDDDDDNEDTVTNDNDDDDDDDDDDDEEEKVKEKVKKEKVKKVKKQADKDAAVATTNNKNEVKPAVDPTDLSVWGMVRTLWSWLRSDLSESLFGDDDEKPAATASAVEGRTFGKIRRLQMALIPIIFKFGVLSAMVAFLVAIGMKSLFLLKVLVVMNALAILGKFLTLKTSLFGSYENAAPSFSYPGWNPHAKESWGPTGLSGSGPASPHHPPPSKEIHLHIHGNAQTQAQLANQVGYNYESSNGWASRSDPYGAYMPTGQYQEQHVEVPNNTDPMSLLPTKYPARSLIR
ncbi:uncharacterized protein LOC133845098 isoform X2 [Drosophila sulfurigaster albostrigata]|uniref:uncharacterized protein LOC133845098 isoform X2 n=1 Tax=Drosophila sulfurigaster albostrigata TaxID=89887 RepID=UPI002D21CDA6|nr:uncharacterized protein LOC133845098 isoform X2 [Drosophila sulfurigaster albostrigata]